MTSWPALAITALGAAALWLGCAVDDPRPPVDAIHVDERPTAVDTIGRFDTSDVQPVAVPPLTELLGMSRLPRTPPCGIACAGLVAERSFSQDGGP